MPPKPPVFDLLSIWMEANTWWVMVLLLNAFLIILLHHYFVNSKFIGSQTLEKSPSMIINLSVFKQSHLPLDWFWQGKFRATALLVKQSKAGFNFTGHIQKDGHHICDINKNNDNRICERNWKSLQDHSPKKWQKSDWPLSVKKRLQRYFQSSRTPENHCHAVIHNRTVADNYNSSKRATTTHPLHIITKRLINVHSSALLQVNPRSRCSRRGGRRGGPSGRSPKLD